MAGPAVITHTIDRFFPRWNASDGVVRARHLIRWCRKCSGHRLLLTLHAFGVITQSTKLFRSEPLDGSE